MDFRWRNQKSHNPTQPLSPSKYLHIHPHTHRARVRLTPPSTPTAPWVPLSASQSPSSSSPPMASSAAPPPPQQAQPQDEEARRHKVSEYTSSVTAWVSQLQDQLVTNGALAQHIPAPPQAPPLPPSAADADDLCEITLAQRQRHWRYLIWEPYL